MYNFAAQSHIDYANEQNPPPPPQMQKVQDGCVAAMVFSGGVAECVKGRRAKPRIKLSLRGTKASREAPAEVRVDLIGGRDI